MNVTVTAPLPAAAKGSRQRHLKLAAYAIAVTAAATAAWHGGPLGAGVAGLALVAALSWRERGPGAGGDPVAATVAHDAAARTLPAEGSGRVGAEVMVEQVVPVWGRQLDVTRDAAAEGLEQLLESFAGMSGALDELSRELDQFSPAIAPGATDDAVQSQSGPMAALLAPSTRAFGQRDEAFAVLGRCSEALTELMQHAKSTKEIARHTRLVAFNASIEAHRGGGTAAAGAAAANGSQAVANELRELSARLATTGDAVHHVVSRLAQEVAVVRREGEARDTSSDELRLELQIRAREALAGMLGAAGASLAGTRALKQSSDALREQLDTAFVNFQFGDRVAQMLSIVANDMTNFTSWVARHPHASQTDAAEWLEALETSYTMEEQRAHHHGNVHVDRGSEVEFF